VLAGGGLLGLGGLLGGGATEQVRAQQAAGQVGTESEPVDVYGATGEFGSVKAVLANINQLDSLGDLNNGDMPSLLVGQSPDNKEIVTQLTGDPPTSDSDYQNRYCGIAMASRDGYEMGSLVGDVYSGDSHISLYTRQDVVGSGSKEATTKRLDIGYGALTTQSAFRNCSKLTVNNQETDTVITAVAGDSTSAGRVVANNSAFEAFEMRQESNGVSKLISQRLGTFLIADPNGGVGGNGAVSHDQIATERVVWDAGLTSERPSNPVEGERFFDGELGQPIWYDGSNWVDAQGATV